jgi:hypothetical protein
MHILRLVLLDFETGGPVLVIRRRRQYPPLSRSSQRPTSQSQVSSTMLNFLNFNFILILNPISSGSGDESLSNGAYAPP